MAGGISDAQPAATASALKPIITLFRFIDASVCEPKPCILAGTGGNGA
jgi:hypothetical protein